MPAGKGLGHVKRIAEAYIAQGGCAATIEPHLRVFDGLKELERAGEAAARSVYTVTTAATLRSTPPAARIRGASFMSILFPEKPKPVVDANEFLFSAVGLAHGHIYGMTHSAA